MIDPIPTPPDVRHLRLPEVLKRTGYSRATLYRRMDAGLFPQGRKDGAIVYWPSDEVDEWQQQKRDAR